MASPDAVNEALLPVLAGNVAGLLNFVPNPEPDHGYAVMNGVVLWATAMASPDAVNLTSRPELAGSVPGSLNFAPNPEPDQGYALIRGEFR